MPPKQPPLDLALADAVCLALIVEEPRHGWALVRELAPDAELGRIWSLSRPLTYRSIESLVDAGLVRRRAPEAGAGPNRQVLSATAAGRRAAAAWLHTPVTHLRDVRTELLLKLALLARSGADPGGLLDAQRRHFAPIITSLEAAAAAPEASAVDRWRAVSSRSIADFLAAEPRTRRSRV